MHQTIIPSSLNLREILKKNETVLCVYGIPHQAHYAELQSWLKKQKDRYLIFVEEDEHLFLKAKELDVFNDPRVSFFFYQHADQQICSQIAWEFLFLNIAYISLIEGRGEQFFKDLASFQHAAVLLASDWRDRGEKILNNLIHNTQLLNGSVLGDSLKGAYSGLPAVICGAGASLNHVIDSLAHLKDRAILFAGGTAINALNAQGVIPHLAAFVDPSPPYERFMRQNIFETPFFYQNRFSSALLSCVHGQRVWMAGSGNYPIEEWLASSCGAAANPCESGWTVATFCVHAALHLGCNPLILVGMDFSCTPDVIYASGVQGEENREQLIAIQDEQGRTLYSKRDWLMSAEWIAETAAAHPERKWVNASDGVSITGIDKKKLSEVIETCLPQIYDIDAYIFSAMAQSSRIATPSIQADLVIADLKKSFKSCLDACNQMLALWEKCFPHSPMDKAEYALIEVEMDAEVCYQHFLNPLWNMWKIPILRKERHPLGKQLHRILFFKNAIEQLKVFS